MSIFFTIIKVHLEALPNSVPIPKVYVPGFRTTPTQMNLEYFKNHSLSAENAGVSPSKKSPNNGREKVVGGLDTPDIFYPAYYVEMIIDKGRAFSRCGGSLIDDNHILTAAHPFAALNFVDEAGFFQKLEMIKIHMKGCPDLKPERIFVHATWGLPENPLHEADLAVIRFLLPQGKKCGRPIQLAEIGSLLPSHMCRIYGWGRIDEDDPRSTPNILQYADMNVFGMQSCKDRLNDPIFSKSEYKHLYKNWTSQFCSTSGKYMSGPCKGDSGGPLVCWPAASQPAVLYGVISWQRGSLCASSDPNMTKHYYQSVGFFRPWIIDIARSFVDDRRPGPEGPQKCGTLLFLFCRVSRLGLDERLCRMYAAFTMCLTKLNARTCQNVILPQAYFMKQNLLMDGDEVEVVVTKTLMFASFTFIFPHECTGIKNSPPR